MLISSIHHTRFRQYISRLKKMASLLLFAFALLAAINVVASSEDVGISWAKIQISPDILCSVPHGDFRVNIYEHAEINQITPNRRKYFYTPIALLDHKSAVSDYNNVTNQAEMRFRVEMWNEIVEQEIVNYLSDYLEYEVKPKQIQVIPLEKVILSSIVTSTTYSLPNNWLPLHKSVWFTLSCLKLDDCHQLAANMRISPRQFEHFRILFGLASQTSQTKETTIGIDNVVSGPIMTKLLQRFGESPEIFLAANDEKKLLSELASKILMETFDESDVVSLNSKSETYNNFKDLLIPFRTIVKKQNDKLWDFVYWNNDNYRPDKASKILNELYKKKDTEDQKKLLTFYQNSDNLAGDVTIETSGSKFPEFVQAGAGNVRSLAFTTKEGLIKFYDETKDNIEWNGADKFVPKPLSLGRINLSQLRDKQSFESRKLEVRYSTAVLSTPMNFVQHADFSFNDEWTILRRELAGNKLFHKFRLSFHVTHI